VISVRIYRIMPPGDVLKLMGRKPEVCVSMLEDDEYSTEADDGIAAQRNGLVLEEMGASSKRSK
jgi:hypothetical protein